LVFNSVTTEIQLSDSGRLTIWAIEAVADAIRTEFGLEPTIKLPNDVQLIGHKVAGVLVEMRAQDKAPHLAVVGIGINVNQSATIFPPGFKQGHISRNGVRPASRPSEFLPSLSCETSILRIARSSRKQSQPLTVPLLRQPFVIKSRRNFGRLDLAAPTQNTLVVRNRNLTGAEMLIIAALCSRSSRIIVPSHSMMLTFDNRLLLEHKAAIDQHLRACEIPVSYTNVFWGGRSEIKPSEISPRLYHEWLSEQGTVNGCDCFRELLAIRKIEVRRRATAKF